MAWLAWGKCCELANRRDWRTYAPILLSNSTTAAPAPTYHTALAFHQRRQPAQSRRPPKRRILHRLLVHFPYPIATKFMAPQIRSLLTTPRVAARLASAIEVYREGVEMCKGSFSLYVEYGRAE